MTYSLVNVLEICAWKSRENSRLQEIVPTKCQVNFVLGRSKCWACLVRLLIIMATIGRYAEISSQTSLFYSVGLEWRADGKSRKNILKDQTTEKKEQQCNLKMV